MKNSFPHRSCILAVLIGLFIFYMPAKAQTEERMRSREEFRECGLGIFIHWGIYSLYGDGEWIMAQKNIHRSEYTKTASAFYPSRFDAEAWVKAIKASGAKYICFTSRHHDGFSMWDSQATDYTIVRATPYGRDVLKELADACHKEGIRLHLYYSLVDWYREDYLRGWSGPEYDKDPQKADYDSYMRFMKQQLTELLTNYGEIGAIWFDGMWDHKEGQRDEVMYKGTMYNVQRDDVQSTKEIAHLYLSTNKVKSMVEAEPGIVYAGMMEGGVQRIDMQTMALSTPEGYYPTNIYVNKLALDSAGILWIGHYSGIDLYDTRNHCMVEPQWRENSARVAEQLLTTAVYDILFYGGKTYLATNKGLFVCEASACSRYTMEDGLPSNVICRMLRDEDGNIWMSTFHGITMIESGQSPNDFINYYLGNGMQAYRYVRGAGDNLPTGELLFPDDNGVTIISPRLLAGKPFTRPIALSSLYVSGKRVTPTQKIRVSYLDNLITMQFSPLDMRDNRNVSYLYRFADDDSPVWHSTLPGESAITLSHLGYGRHVLMVRARDGVAYSEPAKWIIHIIPPLYLRWWAIVLYIILILGVINYIVYAYHRAKERQLLREQLQFYINRSHELPLTLTVELKGNDKILMEKMMEYITAHLDDSDLSVEKIADAVGVSRAQLQRRVKDITGTGVGSFVRELRLKQAAQLLLNGDVNVSQVGYSVGFKAPNVFSTAFKKYFGVSPKEYQGNVQRDNVQGTKDIQK